MSSVASGDLRNYTAEVLRQVSGGTTVTITVDGTPVAVISPVRALRPQFFAKGELLALIAAHQADPGLSRDLEELASDATDELDEHDPSGPAPE